MKKRFSISTFAVLVVFLAMIMVFGISNNPKTPEFLALAEEYVPDGTMKDIHEEFKNNGYWDGAYPKSGCYPISNQNDLRMLSDLVYYGARTEKCVFYMTNDIDLTGFERLLATSYFITTFDGCGYTLSNFEFYDYSLSGTTGFFGELYEGGVIKRVNLDNFDICVSDNGQFVGGLVGYNSGLIDSCSVTNSSVSAQHETGSIVGGLFGMNGGLVVNSYVANTRLEGDEVYGLGSFLDDIYPTIQNCFCYEVEYISTDGTIFPISDPWGDIQNSYWYSTCDESLAYNWEMTSFEDFSSGKVCIWLNGASRGTGSQIFGQDISSSDHPVFLTNANKDTHRVYTVGFYYDGIFYDAIPQNYGGKLSVLPHPGWILPDTATYTYSGTPFSTDTVITQNIKVDTSGGTIDPTYSSLLLSDEAIGNGTKASPLIISTKEDLILLAQATQFNVPLTNSNGETCNVTNAYIELANDITLNEVMFDDVNELYYIKIDYSGEDYFLSPVDNKAYTYSQPSMTYDEVLNEEFINDLYSHLVEWPMIDLFWGSFDGKGHTINGIYMNDRYSQEVGFIYALRGTLKNLNITSYFHGYCQVGGLAFYLDGGSILNCTNNSFISASNSDYIGGIVGIAFPGSTIDNCVNRGFIYQPTEEAFSLGGIAGTAIETTISNCTNYANISSSSYGVGGIAGEIQNNTTIINSANYGDIEALDTYGGIAGFSNCDNDSDTNHITNCANYGEILSPSEPIYSLAGILGTCGSGHTEMINCINYGEVATIDGESYQLVGVSDIATRLTVSYCYWLSTPSAMYSSNSPYWVSYEDCLSFSDDSYETFILENTVTVNGVSTDSLIEALNIKASRIPNGKIWKEVWEDGNCEISFMENCSTIIYHPNVDGIDSISYNFDDETTIISPPLVRTGYTLVGFSYDRDATEPDPDLDVDQIVATSDPSTIVVYAIWEKQYEIKFINNLSSPDQIVTIYVPRSESSVEAIYYYFYLPDLFRFHGWATSPDVTYVQNDDYYFEGDTISISGDLTLYSVWESELDLEGLGTKTDPFLVSSVRDLGEIMDMTLEGYDFEGVYFKQTKDIVIHEFIEINSVKYVAIKDNEETVRYYNFSDGKFYFPNDLTTPVWEEYSLFDVIEPDNIIYIGRPGNPFCGTYDGNFKTIYGYIAPPRLPMEQ